MSKNLTLAEIAQQLRNPPGKESSSKKVKVQLVYAFNGTGKTRLSREFKQLIAPKILEEIEDDDSQLSPHKILYYNAFTEDLFYWDNDLENDAKPKLKIQPNSFTDWVLRDQGQDINIITNFQRYTNDKLTPRFNEERTEQRENNKEVIVKAFSEVSFSLERGNEKASDSLKISKGEESNFVWSVFYSLLEQIINVLNEAEPSERETNQFDELEYIFIDDPVSSLDENHLIELAVDLSQLILSSTSDLKFIITTHNPLFYNVIHNELNRKRGFRSHLLTKNEDGTHELVQQENDYTYSYHLHLLSELEEAISTGEIQKYHFNFLRNIFEKTATFLGKKKWESLLPQTIDGRPNPYKKRILNLSSHSKHAGEEVMIIRPEDKLVLGHLVQHLKSIYTPDLTDKQRG